MKYSYLLLKPDEDGECVKFINDEEMKDIKSLMEDYSICEFIEEYKEDPNYWRCDHGSFNCGPGMLLKVECIIPKPVKVVEKWSIEE
jgi:hypothetical protein